jgi:uncharacterized membrane protein
MLERFVDVFPRECRWTCLGILAGLIAGVLLLFFGFLKTLFVILCAAVGFLAGRILDERPDRHY